MPEARARRVAAGAEAFCRRALAAPTMAYAQLAEPVDPAVESERLRLRRGYRDVFASVLAEASPQASSAPTTPPRSRPPWSARSARPWWARWPPAPTAAHDALVATLVDFCLSSLPTTEGAPAWSP